MPARHGFRRCWAPGWVAALLTLAQASAVAAARPRKFALNWVRDPGAESCISSQELANRIEQTFGPLFVAPRDAELAIEAHIQRARSAEGWAVRIVVSDPHGAVQGERRLSSELGDCRALDPQVELLIVLAIDPELALEQLPPDLLTQLRDDGDAAAELLAEIRAASPPPAAESGPGPAHSSPSGARVRPPADRDEPAESPAARASEPLRLRLALGWAIGGEWLPGLSAGPVVAAGLQLSADWSIAARALWWLGSDAVVRPASERDSLVPFHALLTSLAACREIVRSRAFGWRGCAGLSASARWTGASALRRSDRGLHGNVGPLIATEFGLTLWSPWYVELALVADAPLLRQRFTYRDGDADRALFSPAPIAVSSALSAAYSRLYAARARVYSALEQAGLIEPGETLAEVVR